MKNLQKIGYAVTLAAGMLASEANGSSNYVEDRILDPHKQAQTERGRELRQHFMRVVGRAIENVLRRTFENDPPPVPPKD